MTIKRVLSVLTLACILAAPVTAADAAGNDFIIGELRVDLSSVYQSRDFTHFVWSGQRPTSGGGYTTGWLGVRLGVFDGTLFSGKFTQVGVITDLIGPYWFVLTEVGIQCLQGRFVIVQGGAQACWGNYNDRVTSGNWNRVELVTYGQGFWIARVYDIYGNPQDVAKIMESGTRIYRAQATSEQAYTDSTNPHLRADFYHYDPEYMVWGTGFQDWPASSGGSNNYIYPYPGAGTVCPTWYKAVFTTSNLRFWFAGSSPGPGGVAVCSLNPWF